MPLARNFSDDLCCLEKKVAAIETDIATIESNVTDLQDATAFGNATLVGGTIAVADTSVTAGSIVILGRKTIGGTAGNLSYTVSAGVGFTINSSSGTDTSVVSYHIQY